MMRMKLVFALYFITLSLLAISADLNVVLNDKTDFALSQGKKKIAREISDYLESRMLDEKIGIDVHLEIDRALFIRRLGIVPRSASRLSLPGLDEVSVNLKDRIISQYEPKAHDALKAANYLKVLVTTSREFEKDEQNKIKAMIKEAVQDYPIQTIDAKFEVYLPIAAEIKEDDRSFQRSLFAEAKEQFSQVIIIAIVAGIALFSLAIGLMSMFALKKVEKITKGLGEQMGGALSNISVNMNEGHTPDAPKANAHQSQEQIVTETYEQVKSNIRQFLVENVRLVPDMAKTIVNFHDEVKIFIFLECLNDEERSHWREHLHPDVKSGYQGLLVKISNNQVTDSSLKNSAVELLRDLRLHTHDPYLLKNQNLKSRIQKLDKMAMVHLIESCDEREFGYIAQLADPVQLSSVLVGYPHLLSRFKKVPMVKIDLRDIEVFQKKIDHFYSKQKLSSASSMNISDYLPPELEKEFNHLTGKDGTYWESLSREQTEFIVRFAVNLNVNQLCSFLAVLPKELQAQIEETLPEIKAQQFKRKGIVVNDESFKLKHQVISQLRQNSWQ